jgi:FG-GAP-like repeat
VRRGALNCLFLAAVFLSWMSARATERFDRYVLKTGREPGPVAFGDFDHDGRLDIAIGNAADQTVTIFLNQGAGRFAEPSGSPFVAGPTPRNGSVSDIAVGDVNNDAKPDLVVADHGSPYVTVLLGKGDGAFALAPGSPLDVQVRPHPHGVALGDFDHDGYLDLTVESWADNEIKVFRGNGQGAFNVPGAPYTVARWPYERLRTGDVNADGHLDIVVAGFEQSGVTVLLGDGHGGFKDAPGSPFAVGDNPFAVAIGDLNNDGHADIAVANYSGHAVDTTKDAVNILYGDGSGRFQRGPTRSVGASPVMIAAGDVDGDGQPDVAVSDSSGNAITLLLNDGGKFDRVDVPVGRQPQGIGIAKLTDGRAASIVVTNMEDGTAEVLTMKSKR